MKKQKCGFRQKLGIVLAAGMIISNVSFAVLPVSATNSDGGPETENTVLKEITSDFQKLITQIDQLPSPDSITSDNQEAIKEEVTAASNAYELLIKKDEMLSAEQQDQLSIAKNKLDGLKNYFSTLDTPNTIAENDTTTNGTLTADTKSSIIDSVYERLVATIQEIAAGKKTETKVDLFDLLNTTNRFEDFNAAAAEIKAVQDTLHASLLSDCQNELFWYDKTAGINLEVKATYDSNNVITSGSAIFRFKVSVEYQANDEYTIDPQKLNSANTALAKAQEIVNANAGKSDYEKLLAYKNTICELTSYDYDAAKPGYTGSKAPWQMVSVFDGDPATKVVCEGYSKAFQYLCDLSTFKYAKCYTVTGTMYGGTGEGGHMWNIVSIGSNNYLVDVTNCDEGSVGAPDKLFMTIPSSGTWDGTYIFASASGIRYEYDASSKNLFGESILKLSTTPYDPTKDPVVDDPTDKPGTDNPDDNKPNKPNRPSKPTTSSKPSSKPGSSSSSSDSGNQTGDNTSTQTTPTTIWAVETSPSDQNNYRLEVRSAIEVPAELAGNDTLNTPQKIESQIRSSLTAKGISNDNIRVYDVALQVYTNGTWQDVSAENFPAEGVTVTVPYPSGTDSTYNFVASHLFTKSMNGFPAGHIETFPESGVITKSSAGISFTVHGLSPISVGWSKAAAGTSTNVSPKTGDQSTILLYMVLMILAAAVMGTVYVKQIRVRKK